MALRFRNLNVSPSDPVEQWPVEAVHPAMDRGSVRDWKRLITAIDRDPWGKTARQVEHVLTYDRPYGVGNLMERVIRSARSAAADTEREAVASTIKQAIADSGLTRSEFASRIGTSVSRLSTYANGKVAPSATLMVRIERVAHEAARKTEPSA
ncbi:helix-turn-helix domain-containing protein [Natronoglycomyces albus]|uniref:Helix-turn-helix transcriptional regulator n=1 Tax=Natronoglycomyces albus TaxID=2811108 RepID=A0A895XNJ0_9ACTN|nr:helix-turn-helix transcriptional regulator [Natronoglycomyces albus]QSB05342.1 helix-turn-helix transcriptional regulator [Natronoglycomyces albus]